MPGSNVCRGKAASGGRMDRLDILEYVRFQLHTSTKGVRPEGESAMQHVKLEEENACDSNGNLLNDERSSLGKKLLDADRKQVRMKS